MHTIPRAIVVGVDHPDAFSTCIASALRRAGWEVTAFSDESKPLFVLNHAGMVPLLIWGRLLRVSSFLERKLNERLLRRVVQLQPNLVLVNYNSVTPATIRAIRSETDALVACWFPDALSNFGRQYLIGADYDLRFFKDRYIVRFFREKLGMTETHYLPECIDPVAHRLPELTEEDRRRFGCDLTTAGNLYYYRARMLEPFAGYDMKIWGNVPRWLDSPVRARAMNKTVWGVEKAKAFRAAKIVLNTMHYAEIQGVNTRTFEVPGCGGFQITDSTEAIAEFFEPGTEVVTFTSGADLKEKVDYYLARPEERARIADRASKRTHAEHTFDHRIAVMLDHVRRIRDGRAAAGQ